MLLEDRKPEVQDAEPLPRSRQPSKLMASRRARLLVKLATAAVTILFSYIAIRGLDLRQAWRALRTSDFWWLIPALGAFAMGTIARAARWRSLFTHDRRPPLGATLNAMMIGYLYNNILPARAGEAARIVVLTQRSASPPVEIAGTVVLERLYDVATILVIFFVAEPWLPSVSWFGTAAVVAIALAFAIAAVATVLVIYGQRPLRVLLRPLRRSSLFSEELIERIVAELTQGLSGLHDWRVASEAFLWTLAAWLSSMLCAYLVCVAFHLHLSFAAGVLVMVAIGVGMILPSPPAAIGVFEGAALIALRAFHVSHSPALSFALILHIVNFLPYLLIGALLLRYNARHPWRAEPLGFDRSGALKRGVRR